MARSHDVGVSFGVDEFRLIGLTAEVVVAKLPCLGASSSMMPCRGSQFSAVEGDVMAAPKPSKFSDDDGELERLLCLLAKGDRAAREQLIATASLHMEKQARRMLTTFPRVHRWEQTGDVVNNAIIRFMRSLDQVAITEGKAFLCLCAVHVRRELLDLARKFGGPQSFARNQGTNYQRYADGLRAKIDEAVSPDDNCDEMDRWAAMHEAADQLPSEQREVFDLIFYNERTRAEAAAILRVSEKTIQRRMKEAVAAIDEALKR